MEGLRLSLLVAAKAVSLFRVAAPFLSMEILADLCTVPDLVFNEMRFLVRPEDHQDEVHQNETKRDPTAKERRRQLENGEISNYFNAHQIPTADRRNERSIERHHDTELPKLPNRRETSRAAIHERSPKLAEEELPNIPYLGFGSKGASHRINQPHKRSDSYLIWSETPAAQVKPRNLDDVADASIQSRRSPRVVHAQIPTQDSRRLDSQNAASKGHVPYADDAQDLQPRRSDVSSNIGNKTHNHEAKSKTSQSLPRQPPLRTLISQERAGNARKQQSEATSYHTSEILHIRGRMQALAEQQCSNERSPEQQDHPDAPISTSVSGLLRDARKAVHDYETTHVHPLGPEGIDPSQEHSHPALVSHATRWQRSRTMPSTRLQQEKGTRYMEAMLERDSGRQERPAVNAPADTMAHHARDPGRLVRRQAPMQTALEELDDDEMLDNVPNTYSYQEDMHDGNANSNGGEYLAHDAGTMSLSRSDRYRSNTGGRSAALSTVWPSYNTHASPRDIARPSSMLQGDIWPDRNTRAFDVEEDLHGFWKPNRLL